MKKYNLALAGIAFIYLAAAVIAYMLLNTTNHKRSGEYLVEINVIMKELEASSSFEKPLLTWMEWIKEVSYLDVEELDTQDRIHSFFKKNNGMDRHIEPLWQKGRLRGFVRFDYTRLSKTQSYLLITESVIFLSGFLMLAVMLFIRRHILSPFLKLSNMPFELSKGHLRVEIEENKSRFFGKFIWGMSMLRDNLRTARTKELKLEKEKKLLLLSISHDIKTPLNSIKLYAKALEEGVYDTEEKKRRAAVQIATLSLEIENFVKKIVKNSSDALIHIEAEKSEFYLDEYVRMIKEAYEPKCRLHMTDLVIGSFENRLLSGNKDSAFEVMENILENGLKYGDGRRISIDFYEEDYCQLIRVANTGTPVPSSEMPHLFDSFYRGSNVGGQDGNGLGLYICREIMRRMDGEVFAQREENGMSFTLVFRQV